MPGSWSASRTVPIQPSHCTGCSLRALRPLIPKTCVYWRGTGHVPHRGSSDVAEALCELPEPVDVGERGDQADGGARRAGGLSVDHMKELLVAQAFLVLEGGGHLCLGEAERDLANARVAVAAAAQRDARGVRPALDAD